VGISAMQQEGFTGSISFGSQVGIEVRKLSLYYDNQGRVTDPNSRYLLSQVIRNPTGYAFNTTIIADGTWDLSYDAWAADPEAASATISQHIELVYSLLTQIVVDPAPAP
jgi:hypothetical protein